MSYAKLFSTITESSLWSEAKETRLLFVTMLAKANAIGFVEASILGLARVANLSNAEVEASIKVLESPDPYSKNDDLQGRRIAKVPGGWVVLNYEEYRRRTTEEERREYMRNYMKEYRKKQGEKEDSLFTNVNNVKKSKDFPSASSYSSLKNKRGSGGEKEVATDVPQKEIEDFCESIGLPRSDGEAMFLHWQEQPPEKVRKVKNWRMTIRKWKSFGYLPSQKVKSAGKFVQTDPKKAKIDAEYEAAMARIAAKEAAGA